MNGFFEECDRLGAEVVKRNATWKLPVRVPNLRATAAVGVACFAAMVAVVLA